MKIIEEETKKAGLLLAGIGVLLTILFNLLITQQNIFSENSTIEKNPTSSIIDPALFNYFFDYHIIIGEVLLFLISAVCLIGVLTNSSRIKDNWSSFDYKDWMGNNVFNFQLANFQTFLINNNKETARKFDDIIDNLHMWYYIGIIALLSSILYLIIILIFILITTSSDALLITVPLIVGAASIICGMLIILHKIYKYLRSWYNSWKEKRKKKIPIRVS